MSAIAQADSDAVTRPAASSLHHRVHRIDVVVLGLVGAVVAGFGFWIPNLWADEEASFSAVDRPLVGLVEMVTQQVDAVHAVYYALLSGWVHVVGLTPESIRIPSAIMIGLGVAGTVVLGQRLVGRGAGLAAGSVLAILPAITEMGIEARSYAWSVAVVAWLTVVLVEALHHGRTRWWIGYGLLASLTIALFLNNALVVVAHGVTVILVRAGRRAIVSFLLAAAGAGVLAAPVALLSFRQRGQVGWISEVGWHSIEQVIVQQWFRDSLLFALIAWIVVAVVVMVGTRGRRALGPFLVVVLPWLLLPTSLLLAVSLVLQPLYTPRYLASGAPALALVVGVGISLIPWVAVRVVGVLGLAALTASTYVDQRQPLRFGTEWREIAAFLDESSRPGDAILFNQRVVGPSQYTRGTMTLYGDRLSDFDDIGLLESHRTSGLLRDTFVDPEVLADRLAGVDGAWVVWPRSLEWDVEDTETALEDAGLDLVDTVSLQATDLRYFERTR